jgi:hypothetical protein
VNEDGQTPLSVLKAAVRSRTMQETELRENVVRARETLAQAYEGVKTKEDWQGTRYDPTKKQRERIEEAKKHLADCLQSLEAFLSI